MFVGPLVKTLIITLLHYSVTISVTSSDETVVDILTSLIIVTSLLLHVSVHLGLDPILPESALQLIVVDQRTAVVWNSQFEPVRGSSQLTHPPLSPVLDGVDVDINVVASVRSVLNMGQTKDVKQFMSSSDMIDTATSFRHGSENKNVRSRPREITWTNEIISLDVKYFHFVVFINYDE